MDWLTRLWDELRRKLRWVNSVCEPDFKKYEPLLIFNNWYLKTSICIFPFKSVWKCIFCKIFHTILYGLKYCSKTKFEKYTPITVLFTFVCSVLLCFMNVFTRQLSKGLRYYIQIWNIVQTPLAQYSPGDGSRKGDWYFLICSLLFPNLRVKERNN